MKDNFNLGEYLIENKMTEASRGKARKHFADINLNRSVILESTISLDEAGSRDALYREYIGYETKYGRDKAVKIFEKFYPDVDLGRIIPRFARRNQASGEKADQASLTGVHKKGLYNQDSDWRGDRGYYDEGCHKSLDEVGYTDEDDDYYEDDDFLGAHGSDKDLGIATSKSAERAARRGMKGTDLDVDAADDDEAEFADSEEEFEDPEDISADSQPGATKGAVDTAKIFGKNDPYVEVLVDDLDTYLKGPRGNWRVNVSTNILRRAVDAALQYLDDYEYPRKGVLYLTPNKMGQYDMDARDLGNAVVAVHRRPVSKDVDQEVD